MVESHEVSFLLSIRTVLKSDGTELMDDVGTNLASDGEHAQLIEPEWVLMVPVDDVALQESALITQCSLIGSDNVID